jgi:Uma2 family endonuclease
LSREEFHRRYEAMPESLKAELIDGVVYMAPVGDEGHSQANVSLVTWLGHYRWRTPGTKPGTNVTVILDDRNEPQPDACLMLPPGAGGQTRRDPDDFLHGCPELIAEVARSSKSHDLGPKKALYLRHGVREYIVWRTADGALDWFAARSGQYERREPDERGILRSEVFPGLWLDVPALLRDDGQALLRTLEEGLATTEHADFLARLERTRVEG